MFRVHYLCAFVGFVVIFLFSFLMSSSVLYYWDAIARTLSFDDSFAVVFVFVIHAHFQVIR